jgi:23S rRNA (cytidine1920-2'-O)/16S rRNA (cytidine1409-2'-O)-methyltransferase
MAKIRLDQLLVTRGLVTTRSQAQAIIMSGDVSADGRIMDKPGQAVDDRLEIHLKAQPRYASRAGDKLASVAGPLRLEFRSKTVLDVGSSTGGFTDYCLQNGSTRVFCVDVGTGQLSYKLRNDDRVNVMERTDIRDVLVDDDAPKSIPVRADMAVIDVSFISLTKILEHVRELVVPGGQIVAMLKPQFEAGKPLADKYHGVIPEGAERDQVIAQVRSWLTERFIIENEFDSGVTGMEGNRERFIVLRSQI